MQTKRVLISFLAVWLFIFLFEWFFHTKIMDADYAATASLWRTKEDMHNYCHWLIAGQGIMALVLTIIFYKGYEGRGLGEGLRFGFYFALLCLAQILITYAVQPLTQELAVKWFLGSAVELILVGIILAFAATKIKA